ncbi:MAG TPA: GIY-YIG nuclease family protein [Nitrospirae bacterium]|nr:GIY-YIG nuclease family protein [Nitrospirota bacterium]HDH51157.1 GIY-YIG nuclease family protein [Nitrospirota bacterium]HDK82398.1 GIY-YIG nuclease family protein [Nitrospirota bacterium]HDO25742.1 GIY-YIG nuclease family protein [Nitrospirota bacterium]
MTRRVERLSPFYVYFLKSRKDGSLYIGQTNNIEKRLLRHNKGLIKTTKSRAPFDVIYYEEYNTRREAMLREKYLKSIGGVKEKKTIIKKLITGL